jgi:endo-1,4-beta-mannosidase
MNMVKTRSKSFEAKNAGWIKVRVYIGDVEHFKNAEGFVNEFHVRTFMRYTKYFIDRPSHEGFKRAVLDITQHDHKRGPLVTVKDFRNGEEYMVNEGGLG